MMGEGVEGEEWEEGVEILIPHSQFLTPHYYLTKRKIIHNQTISTNSLQYR